MTSLDSLLLTILAIFLPPALQMRVYKYDAKGKQIGYSMFDASGKLMSGTASPTPATTAPNLAMRSGVDHLPRL